MESKVKLSEDVIQRQCVSYFQWRYPHLVKRFYSVPNGGKRSITTAIRMKQTGALSGVWDLFVSIPKGGYSGLYIEMKAAKGTLTDNQKEFREANKNDYAFEVCKSLEEFQKVVESYLNLKQTA